MRGRPQAEALGLALVLSWLAGLALPSAAQQTYYYVRADEETTEVRFRSKATLETFEGHTSDLSGIVMLDPADLSTMRGELAVVLASLDTGIGLRNKHMRQNVLHTAEHPTANFEITGSSGGKLGRGEPVPVTVQGKLTLHGITQEIEVEVTATLGEDDVLRISTAMQVELARYGIQRPKMLLMKVAETVDITVKAHATVGNPPKRAP